MTPIPAPVRKVRSFLAEKGLACTPENLKVVPSELRNSVGSSMRSSLQAEAKENYKKTKSDADRRAWLSHYILDPASCSKGGYNEQRNTDQIIDSDQVHWLTLEQLGSPTWLNSSEHASKTITYLESKLHEVPGLASDGVLQYKYSNVTENHNKIHERIAGTKATTELTDQEYIEVSADLAKCEEQPKKKTKTAKEVTVEDAEAKRMKQAMNLRSTGLRKFKAEIDTCMSEGSKTEGDLQKLTAKGYPKSMVDWFVGSIQTYLDQVKAFHIQYIQEMTHIPAGQWAMTDITRSTASTDAQLKELVQAFKTFKEGAGMDIKNLVR